LRWERRERQIRLPSRKAFSFRLQDAAEIPGISQRAMSYHLGKYRIE
jgi:hypothetical protein